MTSAAITMHDFPDRDAQADALDARVADHLRDGIAQRGRAVLAVSGGSTPKAFFDSLARAPLDWPRVTVTLVDERWVPDTDERSNAKLVRTHLLRDAAAAATFVPLYGGEPSPDAGLAAARARIDALATPFDAVVLGMGDDGHTASFFPGGDHLAEALDLRGDARVLPMRAPDAGEARITLTLPALLDTRALYLLIAGDGKRALLEDARADRDDARGYPIRAVLTQPRVPLAVFWSP